MGNTQRADQLMKGEPMPKSNIEKTIEKLDALAEDMNWDQQWFPPIGWNAEETICLLEEASKLLKAKARKKTPLSA
jgi:hypothetical protein